MHRPALVLLAMLLLAPVASADDCLILQVAGTVIQETQNYPRCELGDGSSLYECFCPWREPAQELECPLPDNIP